MRAIVLLLVLLSWASSLAQAAECPMAGASAAGSVASAHHHAPEGHPHDAPARHAAECAVGMPCTVPALVPTDPGLPRAVLAAAPATVRPVRAYASPDLAAEPPPPRLAPRF